jgi:imidazolonepropionase
MNANQRRGKRETREKVDILIANADELVTLAGSSEKPRTGSQMREISVVRDGALALKDGRIVAVGKTAEVARAFKTENVINANGKTVLPGFVDPHTHLVFAGSRENELQMRIEGVSYMEILASGGGILQTVRETRKANVQKLVDSSLRTLDVMLEHGTTTVEGKSGYGLTVKDELKILEVMKGLDRLHTVDVVSTFLGAHAIPPEYKGNTQGYVSLVAEEMLPKVAEKGLADFCDVFCERGVFNLEQTRHILTAAKRLGLKPKLHADEMSGLGGAELAADVGAVSADHLLFSSVEGIKALARSGVVAVLLPAAAFSLMNAKFADARLMIDVGVPVALGSDFNPSCYVENQQLIIAFACHLMKLMAAEAITAATINAAHAVGRGKDIGSLEVGKKGDVVVLDVPNHKSLGYRFGVNLVDKVVKNGRLVFDKEVSDMRRLSLFSKEM